MAIWILFGNSGEKSRMEVKCVSHKYTNGHGTKVLDEISQEVGVKGTGNPKAASWDSSSKPVKERKVQWHQSQGDVKERVAAMSNVAVCILPNTA